MQIPQVRYQKQINDMNSRSFTCLQDLGSKRSQEDDTSSIGSRRLLMRSQNKNSESKSRLISILNSTQKFKDYKDQEHKKNMINIGSEQIFQSNPKILEHFSDKNNTGLNKNFHSANINNKESVRYVRLSSPNLDLTQPKKILDYRTRQSTPYKVKQPDQEMEKKNAEDQDTTREKKIKTFAQQSQLQQRIEILNVKIGELTKQKQEKEQQLKLIKEQIEKSKKGDIKPSRLITILDNKSNNQVLKQNKSLKEELDQVKQQFEEMKNEKQKYSRLNNSYHQQLTTMKTKHQEQLRVFSEKVHTEEVSKLHDMIENLKRQLNERTLNFQKQNHILQSALQYIQKEVNYYKIANYCLKKQLNEQKLQSSKKVSLNEHNDLKTKFKKLSIKCRQLTMRNNKMSPSKEKSLQDLQFELTPQKQYAIISN